MIRFGHALVKTPLKADYVVGTQLFKRSAERCDLSVLSAFVFRGFINDAPEVFLVHKRCPSPQELPALTLLYPVSSGLTVRKLTVCATLSLRYPEFALHKA